VTETALQAAILGALHRIGAWAWRVNAGQRGAARMAPAGTPDICVVDPPGWLEVKTTRGRLGAAQDAWHAEAERRGVRVAIVRSVAEAVETVREWESER